VHKYRATTVCTVVPNIYGGFNSSHPFLRPRIFETVRRAIVCFEAPWENQGCSKLKGDRDVETVTTRGLKTQSTNLDKQGTEKVRPTIMINPSKVAGGDYVIKKWDSNISKYEWFLAE